MDGGVLAAFLAAIDPAELMTDVEVLDLVTAWSRVTAWSQARGLRAVAEFARRPESVPGSDPLVARARRHRPGSDARWHTEAELGAALSMSPAAAEHRLATACRSVEQFPATLRALECGRVDAARLEAMIAHAGGCQDAVAAQVEAAVLAGGDHGSAAGFGREVRRAGGARSTRWARRRGPPSGARTGSCAPVRRRPRTTMWLEAYLPAEDAAAVRAVIEAAARTHAWSRRARTAAATSCGPPLWWPRSGRRSPPAS